MCSSINSIILYNVSDRIYACCVSSARWPCSSSALRWSPADRYQRRAPALGACGAAGPNSTFHDQTCQAVSTTSHKQLVQTTSTLAAACPSGSPQHVGVPKAYTTSSYSFCCAALLPPPPCSVHVCRHAGRWCGPLERSRGPGQVCVGQALHMTTHNAQVCTTCKPRSAELFAALRHRRTLAGILGARHYAHFMAPCRALGDGFWTPSWAKFHGMSASSTSQLQVTTRFSV